MEKFYRILLSKRLNLQSFTLITMLEAYSDLGILEKMEKFYYKVLNSNAYMKDDLIRKVANVYVEHCRFARLEEFGNEISGRTGRSELVWTILLLSAAGLLSRRGMDSIARNGNSKSKTEHNIHKYTHRGLGWLVGEHGWEPHIPGSNPLYYGLASSVGQRECGPDAGGNENWNNCTHVLEKWKRYAYLEATVEMKTDPLVISTFGKGPFILKCEKLFTSRIKIYGKEALEIY
ncbi:hypothetical protein M5K25_000122 [Dendrobium thyrsiflorum]|uniref:Pentatricopeptide repeat-containing protein n=1 Tax=Dendrobium thyrsiflorum TaxID=117978 RepID=A0ABD0VT49_DENTH